MIPTETLEHPLMSRIGCHEYHQKSVEELEKMRDLASWGDPNADLSHRLQSVMLTIGVIISEMAASPPNLSVVELVKSQNLNRPLRIESVNMDCLDRILTEIESMFISCGEAPETIGPSHLGAVALGCWRVATAGPTHVSVPTWELG